MTRTRVQRRGTATATHPQPPQPNISCLSQGQPSPQPTKVLELKAIVNPAPLPRQWTANGPGLRKKLAGGALRKSDGSSTSEQFITSGLFPMVSGVNWSIHCEEKCQVVSDNLTTEIIHSYTSHHCFPVARRREIC
ncbi:hypothetical protein CRV24_002892 [Beauveria bassiana]|nr:hypothetical protein CRV24_002892 [Beauveria bassiana]